jgi:hypothetical protein
MLVDDESTESERQSKTKPVPAKVFCPALVAINATSSCLCCLFFSIEKTKNLFFGARVNFGGPGGKVKRSFRHLEGLLKCLK